MKNSCFAVLIFLAAAIVGAASAPTEEAWKYWKPDAVNRTGQRCTLYTAPPGSVIGNEDRWGENYIYSTVSFSADQEDAEFSVSGLSPELWRTVYLVLCPVEQNRWGNDHFMLNFSAAHQTLQLTLTNTRDGSETELLKEDLKWNSAPLEFKISVKNGMLSGTLSGGATKTFQPIRVIPEDQLYRKYYWILGVRQNGNLGKPASLSFQKIAFEKKSVAGAPNGNLKYGRVDGVDYAFLGEVANRTFQDEKPLDADGGWTDQGTNDLRSIPGGFVQLRDLPFYINDRLDEVGNGRRPGAISVKNPFVANLPEQVEFAFRSSGKWLYFLHTAAWAEERIGVSYFVVYEDGSEVEIPLRNQRNIGDWHFPKDLPEALVVWTGENPTTSSIGIYAMEWKNPFPGKKIAGIRMVSKDAKSAVFLIGVTAAEQRLHAADAPSFLPSTAARVVCEYRNRIPLSLQYGRYEGPMTLTRTLPVAGVQNVHSLTVSVNRLACAAAAAISCTIGGETRTVELKPGEYRARFTFTDRRLRRQLADSRNGIQITLTCSDPAGLGAFYYQNHPGVDFIPNGEDAPCAIADVFCIVKLDAVTADQRKSGMVETPLPVSHASPVTPEHVAAENVTAVSDLRGSLISLNGRWQAAPARDDSAEIPQQGWETVTVPGDLGQKMHQAGLRRMWLRYRFAAPAELADCRIDLECAMISDSVEVYVNGKKCGEHFGTLPLSLELTGAILPGRENEIALLLSSAQQNIKPRWIRVPLTLDVRNPPVKLKGHSYRIGILQTGRGLSPEVRLFYRGKLFSHAVGSLQEVEAQGDGAYYRNPRVGYQTGSDILYFSTPGNRPLNEVIDDLEVEFVRHGDTGAPTCYGLYERSAWDTPLPTGVLQDIELRISGRERIADAAVKTSVQHKKLQVEAALEQVPPGSRLSAEVYDGSTLVLTASTPAESNTTLVIPWEKPRLWQPADPYLYWLKLELKQGDRVLDRRYIRFGFREFRADGPRFLFNEQPFKIFGNAILMGGLYTHRSHWKWIYADNNYRSNFNLIRFHLGGIDRESAEIADEMGMLIEAESPGEIPEPRSFYNPETRAIDVNAFLSAMEPYHRALAKLRNHPSIIVWSIDNEKLLSTFNPPSTFDRQIAEGLLSGNALMHRLDDTRVIFNNGDNGFVDCQATADSRLGVVNLHYYPYHMLSDWKKTFGKPLVMGEISMGDDFAWTYHSQVNILLDQQKDAKAHLGKRVNAAKNFIAAQLIAARQIDIAGAYPFGNCVFDPFAPIWKDQPRNFDRYASTPEVKWPSCSGFGSKPQHFRNVELLVNFFDPGAPRNPALSLGDTLKDNWFETTKLRPRLSPEIVVKLVDDKANGIAGATMLLAPRELPGAAVGVVSDLDGTGWFRCTAGPGEYTLRYVLPDGRKGSAVVTPAVPGEWLNDVKTVVVTVAP